MTPQELAVALLGPVHWQSPVLGFCRCPGETSHSSVSGKKDCRVTLDGAPTVYCFHTSCAEACKKASQELRARLGGVPGTLVLPSRGSVASATAPEPSNIVPFGVPASPDPALEAFKARKDRIFRRYHWPLAAIVSQSPCNLQEYAPEDFFRRFMLLWNPEDVIWIGNVYDSGSETAASHFRTVSEWLQIGPAMGNFTCPSVFPAGTCSRSDKNALERRYFVVESDILSRDQVGAVFRWLREALKLRLHCIVDTAGKSLHGWFDVPPEKHFQNLKMALQELGCDTKLFNRTQPVRLPGAFRGDKVQSLVWFRK